MKGADIMERKLLEEMGMDKSGIDRIMAEHGRTTERLKKELAEAKETIAKINKELSKLSKVDIGGVKKASAEWKKKYEAAEKERKKLSEESVRNEALADIVSEISFTSKLARKAFISEFKVKSFNPDKGKFPEAESFILQMKEYDPGAFKTAGK